MRVAARKSGSESKARERRLRSEQMRNVAKTERRNKESTATAAALRSSHPHKEDDGDGKIERLPVGADDAASPAKLLPHYPGPHFQTQNTKCGAPNYGCVSI